MKKKSLNEFRTKRCTPNNNNNNTLEWHNGVRTGDGVTMFFLSENKHSAGNRTEEKNRKQRPRLSDNKIKL